MDVDENILVVFEIDWEKRPPEVQQTKWALTGGLLDKKHFPLSLSGCDLHETKLQPRHRSSRTFGHKTGASLEERSYSYLLYARTLFAICDSISRTSWFEAQERRWRVRGKFGLAPAFPPHGCIPEARIRVRCRALGVNLLTFSPLVTFCWHGYDWLISRNYANVNTPTNGLEFCMHQASEFAS